MSVAIPDRTIAGAGVVWRARRWSAGNTTDRWQDKRAHSALRSVGCFCWHFSGIAHLAALRGNVRRNIKPLFIIGFAHLAELRHAR